MKEPVEMPHGFILLMEYKPTFGQDLLYPKNKAAKMICEVMNRSTLNLAQAKQLSLRVSYQNVVLFDGHSSDPLMVHEGDLSDVDINPYIFEHWYQTRENMGLAQAGL